MTSSAIHSKLLADISNFGQVLDHERENLNKGEVHTLENSLNAVKDISSLWQAHTTKLALAFKPPISGEAASKCLEEAAKLPKLIASAYNGLNEEQDKTGLMKPQVEEHIFQLFDSEKAFLNELNEAIIRERSLLQDLRKASADSNAKTLVSVGQVWESCKKCQELINMGPVGVLQLKITAYSGIIKDAIEEFQELMAEGEEGESSNVSGSNDLEEVDDFEDFNFTSPSQPLSKEVRQLGVKWNDVFIRLSTVIAVLCKTLCKRLDNTEATKISQINKSVQVISEATDDLVFGFSDDSITDVKEGFVSISKELQTITDLITLPNDNFSTQLRAYTEKFKNNN